MTAGGDPLPAFDLAGRVALVTGAGSAGAIGFACARRLGSLGAGVICVDDGARGNRAAELRAAGVDADALPADLTHPAAADALVAATVARFGRLDVVVNNAGMTSVSDPEVTAALQATTDAQWRSALDRNLSTAFHVSRAAIPHLLGCGCGQHHRGGLGVRPGGGLSRRRRLPRREGRHGRPYARARHRGRRRGRDGQRGAAGLDRDAVVDRRRAGRGRRVTGRPPGAPGRGRRGRRGARAPRRRPTSPGRSWWSTAGNSIVEDKRRR